MDDANKDLNTLKDSVDKEQEPQQLTEFNMAELSESMFPESPAYESEDITSTENGQVSNPIDTQAQSNDVKELLKVLGDNEDQPEKPQTKRKLSDDTTNEIVKVAKLDEVTSTQNLDDEVSKYLSKEELVLPSTSRVRTPLRSSPRLKRSNSTDLPTTPKTPKSRSASVDTTKQRKTPSKTPKKRTFSSSDEVVVISSDSSSRPSIEFVKEIPKTFETIAEESSLNDSQNFHLVLSPTPDEEAPKLDISSDPVIVRDRQEILNPGKIKSSRSEGYSYSDQSANLSQPLNVSKDKTTDQESTDSVCSVMDSPDQIPSMASKLISKLSNGNSSTPTEQAENKNSVISISDSDSTPDLVKMNAKTANGNKNFSNTSATPSTISPLQNGHSIPMRTPQIPTFDIHVSHNEDGEFLSCYFVRIDNDLGVDMCKEYQRFSKRFTIDPYLADVSSSNSPSSVTSAGMVNLPNRVSFASTTSSNSSNRTSDGAFVVPQPPRKSVSHPSSTTVKGCDALIKKINDIFAGFRENSILSNTDDKISVGIQASLSNGSVTNGEASPEEVNKCDKTTPKSSLKKRARGRRPLAGKTKRAILPTQSEEPEDLLGLNSPEMVPTEGRRTPEKSDDKPLSALLTPKSVSKLKKKRAASPRPATPIEKPIKTEYPGFPPNTLVLAKWVDKRYYSGKVLDIPEPNKYLIKFDDGQTKALLDDFIIFGDKRTLPLQGQSVYAMVDEDQNYEPSLVLSVEENDSGTVTYRCTTDGDSTIMVTASELYLTEDQARSIISSAPKSPSSAPTTPRRRGLRELDLDNIIQGPRSARSRDKSANNSARKRVPSPRSPKASTSGIKSKSAPVNRKRIASESSEFSENSNSAPPTRVEEVAGVEPEVQKTPRKIDGVKAGPLHLKGLAKQTTGKKNSKLAKFSNDEDTILQLGPIPETDSKIFENMLFLLTCTESPKPSNSSEKEIRHYSSEEDGGTTASAVGTDTEDLQFTDKQYNKERLKDQLEAGGGVVYSHFDEIPRSKYSSCKLIAPRPCLTAKYIQCLAANIRAVSHAWVIASCTRNQVVDTDAFTLPAGYSITKQKFINWTPQSGKRNTHFFKDKLILVCGEQDTFVKFWDRICTLAGANTRVVDEEELNMTGAIACVTEWDCPHEVQNKANQDNIPLVSTTWVVQCLIEGKVIAPTSHDKFSFMYTEPE